MTPGLRPSKDSCGSPDRHRHGHERMITRRRPWTPVPARRVAAAKIGRMGARIASGLAAHDGGVDAFAEAASRAQLGLGGAPADLVAVFAGAPNLDHVEEGLAAVEARLGSRALMGCGAQGVLGAGRELEHGGVVVWAASLPEGEVESFHLDAVPAGESTIALSGMPVLDGADAMFMLVDPYSFPLEPLLAQLAEDYPGLPVLGGVASSGSGPGTGVLLHDDAV